MTLPIGFHPRLARAEREADALKDQARKIAATAAVQWFGDVYRSYEGQTFLFDAKRPDRISWWHWEFTKPKTKKRKKQWVDWRANRESVWLERFGDLRFYPPPTIKVWKEGKKYPPLPSEKECSEIFYSVIATMPAEAVRWAFYYGQEKLREAKAAGEKWGLKSVHDRYCIMILVHYKRAAYWKARLDPSELWKPRLPEYMPGKT